VIWGALCALNPSLTADFVRRGCGAVVGVDDFAVIAVERKHFSDTARAHVTRRVESAARSEG
jgi:hypothetical protein